MTLSEFINKVGFKVRDEDVNKVNQKISDIKKTATKLLGAIGIGFSLTAINGLIEEFGAVNNAIRSSTGTLGDMNEVQNLILTKANEARTTYKDMASTVSKLVQANSNLFSTEDAVEFSSTVTKLLKTPGKSYSEIQSATGEIVKSFQTGKVEVSSLNKLISQAPEVANVLAKSLGVSKDQLITMASSGRISAKDLKNAFMNASGEIDGAFSQTDMTISDALKNIRNKWGLWLAQTDKTLAVTKTIAKTMVSGFNAVMSVLNKLKTGVVWFSEKLGGTDKLLKFIAISAGAIFVALKGQKILTFLKSTTSLLNIAKLKMLALVAVIVLIALLVEDFIKFIKGQPSLLGAMLEKCGIDCEAIRQKIVNVWNKIKGFLSEVWEGIKGAAQITWGAIKDFFDRHGERIKKNFERYWNFIKDFLSTIWNILYKIISSVFGSQEDAVDGSQKSIRETIVDGWQKILDAIIPILDALFEVWDVVFNALMMVVEWILGIIKKIWDKWGKDIIGYLQKWWSAIKKVIDGVLGIIKGLANFVAGVFSGDWKRAWEGIKQVFAGIWKAIKGIIDNFVAWIQLVFMICVDIIKMIWKKMVGFFQGIWNGIVRIFSVVGSWFSNIFSNAWSGIKNAFSAVVSWFQGIWDGIKGVFSGIGSWFSDIFSSASDGIKKVFGGIKDWFSNVFSRIKEVAIAPINGIISGLNVLIRGANKISFDVPDWVPGIGGKKFGFNIEEIPMLAKGGYVGKNKPRPVIIGDNKTEGEIVSPISKMRDTMMEVLRKFVASGKPSGATRILSNSTSNRSIIQNVEINNEFNGDKAIQKQAAKTMDKSAEDVTAFLARGLAFAK